MKNYLAGLLLIVVTVSCNTRNEKEPQNVSNKPVSMSVGIDNRGDYQIKELDTMSVKWSADLKERFEITDGVSFSKFEIVKTVTKGDRAEDAYLLLTHTSDNSVIAIVLDKKDEEFLYYYNGENKKNSCQAIMCKSINDAVGCMPDVILHNNKKRLMCSSDTDCEKTVVEVFW